MPKILSNEVYIGDLIQRAYSNRHNPSRKSKFRDREERIITEDTHRGLIDKTTFENIREIKKEKQNYLPYHSLENIIKDGGESVGVEIQRDHKREGRYNDPIQRSICGRNLRKQYGPRGLKYHDEICYCYYCKSGDRLELEKSHVRIYEADLNKILVDTLKKLFSSFYKKDRRLQLKIYLENISAEKVSQVSIKTDVNSKKTASLRINLQEQYENYVKREVLLSDFKVESKKISNQIKALKSELKVFDERIRNIKRKKREIIGSIDILFCCLDAKNVEIDKELVDTLISHIEISEYKQVTIYFKFRLDKDVGKQLEVEHR